MHSFASTSNALSRLKQKLGVTRVAGVMSSETATHTATTTSTQVVVHPRTGLPQTMYEYPDHSGTYYTLREVADLIGMHYQTVSFHLKEGYTVEQIKNKAYLRKRRLGTTESHESSLEWPIGSGERHTVQALADQHGLEYHTLYYRLRRGWDLTRALTTKI